MITCPNCGELTKNEIKIYNENLRKQSFSILPILPTCIHCGAEVAMPAVQNGEFKYKFKRNIIVLNGTCGSGKSTVAEILAGKGYHAIDGDCVIQVVKHKKSIKNVNFDEMADETACELDILSLLFDDNGDNDNSDNSDNKEKFVLSTIILPEDLDKYIKIFESRNLDYKFFLLKPDYQTAVERCQSRTCHKSITPEYWIKYFYDLLRLFESDERMVIVDNTNITAEETAEYILALC